jgi:hypothetical protein
VTASAAMARFHATNAKGILGPRRSVSCKGTPVARGSYRVSREEP